MDMVKTDDTDTISDGSRDAEDVIKRLLQGDLRRQLGLTTEQLRIGLTIARNHLARGAYADAFRLHVALVLCDPLEVDFQVGLANCASLMGEHHVAIQAASAVIALAPTDPRGYLLSGRSCLMTGNLKEAREDLDDALRLADSTANAGIAKEAGQLLERLSVAAAS